MPPTPGSVVFARIVTVHSTRFDPVRVVGYGDDLLSLELWDQAPVSAAPTGYCKPWWARADGRWYIVAAPRKGSRTVRLDIVAYDVTDEVRLRLSAIRASKDVTDTVLGHLGYGPGDKVSRLIHSKIA